MTRKYRCENCIYRDDGQCRLYPPVITGMWPSVASDDWCGHHKWDQIIFIPELPVGDGKPIVIFDDDVVDELHDALAKRLKRGPYGDGDTAGTKRR